MIITRKSPLTGTINEMDLDITQEQLDRFENRRSNGEFIQDIFPELNADQREFILSGYTREDWEHIFGSDNEFGSDDEEEFYRNNPTGGTHVDCDCDKCIDEQHTLQCEKDFEESRGK